MFLLYPLGALAIVYFRWLAPLFGRRHLERMQHFLPRQICRIILSLNGVRLDIRGMQNLVPVPGQPRILAVNHNSRFDGYILLAICRFPFKSFWSNTAHVTTEKFRFLQTGGEVFDLFFVHDKNDMRRTIKEFKKAEDYLNSGATVSFFPEGQFSSDGLVRGFGSSCIGLAIRTSACIVPVVLFDSNLTFEKDRTNARGKQMVKVEILPPFTTFGMDRTDIAALTSQIENLMNAKLQHRQSA